ncbi:hypothetical protein [Ruficoccus sp. ZRK36]|uniref:hypothetical protein n=1 Tax=Ruficoccus sp. ZRK36 TaxID=2866311 RepID=UPI001C72E477|nr:hypothetical protein [Ruficoccus sp. ZRK36]QYY36363.1 hypothetical protein K0V07_02585 [Ruficoccus sp. ZRK36]
MTKTILLALSLLLPLGYAHAENDSPKPEKGKGGMVVELQNASDEDLVTAYGSDRAFQIRAIVDEMKEHQEALMKLRKQLRETTGGKSLDKAAKGKKGKPESDDDAKGKGKNKDKDKDKGKGKNKDKDYDDDGDA